MNRRNFIRKLIGAAAGIAVAPFVPPPIQKLEVKPDAVYRLSSLEEAVRKVMEEMREKLNRNLYSDGQVWAYMTNGQIIYANHPKGMKFPMYMREPIQGLKEAMESNVTYGNSS